MYGSIEAIVFDVDGVLVDVQNSYPKVVAEAVRIGWPAATGRPLGTHSFDVSYFNACKGHGACNDDYDIAWLALCAAAKGIFRGEFPSLEEWREVLASIPQDISLERWIPEAFGSRVERRYVRRICEELYMGEQFRRLRGLSPQYSNGKGYYRLERPQIFRHWRSFRLPVGIYTGRPREELELALQQIGWEDFPFSHAVTPDSGPAKPSPEGLSLLSKRFETTRLLFIGDATSDLMAWRGFASGAFIGVGAPLRQVYRPTMPSLQAALVAAGLQ
ncbi:MAG: hypothetical protein K9L28_00630 [Synergistales bacterium]|nr:hypothetical protein [Synergistales bacterium]